MEKGAGEARKRRLYLWGIAAVFVLSAGAFLLTPAVSGRSYVDPGHRFSVQVPAGASAHDFVWNGSGVENLEISRGPDDATQITVSLWPATTTLTKAALLHSYPWLASNTTTPRAVGGTAGIEFRDIGSGAENVWFAHGGYLYMAVDVGNDPALLSAILGSWKFF